MVNGTQLQGLAVLGDNDNQNLKRPQVVGTACSSSPVSITSGSETCYTHIFTTASSAFNSKGFPPFVNPLTQQQWKSTKSKKDTTKSTKKKKEKEKESIGFGWLEAREITSGPRGHGPQRRAYNGRACTPDMGAPSCPSCSCESAIPAARRLWSGAAKKGRGRGGGGDSRGLETTNQYRGGGRRGRPQEAAEEGVAAPEEEGPGHGRRRRLSGCFFLRFLSWADDRGARAPAKFRLGWVRSRGVSCARRDYAMWLAAGSGLSDEFFYF